MEEVKAAGPQGESGDCAGLGAGTDGRRRCAPLRRATASAIAAEATTEAAASAWADSYCWDGWDCHRLPPPAKGLPPSAKTCHDLPRAATIQRGFFSTGRGLGEASSECVSERSLGLRSGWGGEPPHCRNHSRELRPRGKSGRDPRRACHRLPHPAGRRDRQSHFLLEIGRPGSDRLQEGSANLEKTRPWRGRQDRGTTRKWHPYRSGTHAKAGPARKSNAKFKMKNAKEKMKFRTEEQGTCYDRTMAPTVIIHGLR